MARKKYSKDELTQVRARVAKLMTQRWTQEEIALELSLSQQTVSYHWNQLKKESVERMSQSVDCHVAEALEALRVLQIMHAKRLSDALQAAEKQAAMDEPQSQRVPPEATIQAAASQILKIEERRCKLLGLDRPPAVSWATKLASDEELTMDERIAVLTEVLNRTA